jgi:hypothetical protein
MQRHDMPSKKKPPKPSSDCQPFGGSLVVDSCFAGKVGATGHQTGRRCNYIIYGACQGLGRCGGETVLVEPSGAATQGGISPPSRRGIEDPTHAVTQAFGMLSKGPGVSQENRL